MGSGATAKGQFSGSVAAASDVASVVATYVLTMGDSADLTTIPLPTASSGELANLAFSRAHLKLTRPGDAKADRPERDQPGGLPSQ